MMVRNIVASSYRARGDSKVSGTSKMKKHRVLVDITVMGTSSDKDKTAVWVVQQLLRYAMERMPSHDLARRSSVKVMAKSLKRLQAYDRGVSNAAPKQKDPIEGGVSGAPESSRKPRRSKTVLAPA